MWVSQFCSTGVQQFAYVSPPIGDQVKHSAPLLNLFFHFRHEHAAANPPLLSPEDGWPFLAECHCGLVCVSRAKTTHDGLKLILESALQLALQRAVEQALALAYGQGRTAKQFVSERLYFGVQRARIDQAMKQSHLSGCG